MIVKGESMPQTPEQFSYMTELYEKKMLQDKKEISRLKERIHRLEQRVSHVRVK